MTDVTLRDFEADPEAIEEAIARYHKTHGGSFTAAHSDLMLQALNLDKSSGDASLADLREFAGLYAARKKIPIELRARVEKAIGNLPEEEDSGAPFIVQVEEVIRQREAALRREDGKSRAKEAKLARNRDLVERLLANHPFEAALLELLAAAVNHPDADNIAITRTTLHTTTRMALRNLAQRRLLPGFSDDGSPGTPAPVMTVTEAVFALYQIRGLNPPEAALHGGAVSGPGRALDAPYIPTFYSKKHRK